MRGLYSSKTEIRHKIFTEIARMAYEGQSPEMLEELPYKIVPGEIATYRDSIFLERAVVGERLRVAMGMSLRKVTEHAPISKGVEASVIEEKYYEPPLINVIKFACNSCPEKRVMITEGCQGCLEHPCVEVCPKKAVHMEGGRSHIDEDACIKCGKCLEACPYNAIIKQERPCSKACGMNAIGSDEYGRAEIDQDKCVSCGQCIAVCPTGALREKDYIDEVLEAVADPGKYVCVQTAPPVYAIVAPAIAGQFPGMENNKIRGAFQALGFTDVREVAVGADLCTVEEAKDFLEEVPEKLPFMATSCCPSWSMMAKKLFPEQAKCISMALTPMVLTARLIKQKEPNCKIVFVGPCAAKKLEASRKGVDWKDIPEGEPLFRASADGRGFAVSGGVAEAVVHAVKRIDPDREVKVMNAEGLQNCKKMLQMAKIGKYNGYLLEGMACPGGCVAGAGTIQTVKKAAAALEKMKKEALFTDAYDSKYRARLESLEKFDVE